MKHKRVWTDEQKVRAAERMKAKWEQKKLVVEAQEATVAVKEQPPEVQAVIDSMDPARKAKLENIQARQMAQLAQTKEGQEALDRLKARHNPLEVEPIKSIVREMDSALFGPETKATFVNAEPPKPIVREVPMKAPFRITGSQSGQCVSEMGPCQCGEPKLKWHPICLKVKV